MSTRVWPHKFNAVQIDLSPMIHIPQNCLSNYRHSHTHAAISRFAFTPSLLPFLLFWLFLSLELVFCFLAGSRKTYPNCFCIGDNPCRSSWKLLMIREAGPVHSWNWLNCSSNSRSRLPAWSAYVSFSSSTHIRRHKHSIYIHKIVQPCYTHFQLLIVLF